jgi:hypothetical protein
LKKLLQLAYEEQLRALIQMYVDSAPDCEAKKYPSSDPDSVNSVASNVVKIVSQSDPGFFFDHLGIRNLTLNFYSQVAAVTLDFFNVWL